MYQDFSVSLVLVNLRSIKSENFEDFIEGGDALFSVTKMREILILKHVSGIAVFVSV